jgi:hypothetical protein
MWCQCQLVLDEHLEACAHCDTLGLGPYCTGCGERLLPEARTCERCQAPGPGPYCAQCGAALGTPVDEAMGTGTFDWAAWAKSLAPFLGGLTAQEQRVLTHEGLRNGTQAGGEYGLRSRDRDA